MNSSSAMALFTSRLLQEGSEVTLLPPSELATEESATAAKPTSSGTSNAADADPMSKVDEAAQEEKCSMTASLWGNCLPQPRQVPMDRDGGSGNASASDRQKKYRCADLSSPDRSGSGGLDFFNAMSSSHKTECMG